MKHTHQPLNLIDLGLFWGVGGWGVGASLGGALSEPAYSWKLLKEKYFPREVVRMCTVYGILYTL